MTPVASGWEARYLRASRAAHRAWAGSQPQYVIPGVLEEVDVSLPESSVDLLEPAAPSYTYPPGRRARQHNDGPGRMSVEDVRGRGHWR